MLPPYRGMDVRAGCPTEGELWGQGYKTTCFTLFRVTGGPPGSPAGHQKYGELFGGQKVMLDFFCKLDFTGTRLTNKLSSIHWFSCSATRPIIKSSITLEPIRNSLEAKFLPFFFWIHLTSIMSHKGSASGELKCRFDTIRGKKNKLVALLEFSLPHFSHYGDISCTENC